MPNLRTTLLCAHTSSASTAHPSPRPQARWLLTVARAPRLSDSSLEYGSDTATLSPTSRLETWIAPEFRSINRQRSTQCVSCAFRGSEFYTTTSRAMCQARFMLLRTFCRPRVCFRRGAVYLMLQHRHIARGCKGGIKIEISFDVSFPPLGFKTQDSRLKTPKLESGCAH